VALARALAPGPRLLLLEDPTGALPHLQVGPIKALLRALAAETGVAILFNTDDITACYGLADRIGVMQSGVLRQIGTPQDLYDNPLSLPVAQALGPLNRMAGTVVDLDDDIAAIRLAGGALVEARFVDDLKPGEACVVALRPERIAVATGNLAELGDGAVPVHLVETVFAGDQQRLRFSMDRSRGQAPEIFVTRPVGAILPRTADMCLAWQPHHARAFRTEAA
jgi:putative spermidine/putrescine transport system ATP-binding protein